MATPRDNICIDINVFLKLAEETAAELRKAYHHGCELDKDSVAGRIYRDLMRERRLTWEQLNRPMTI